MHTIFTSICMNHHNTFCLFWFVFFYVFGCKNLNLSFQESEIIFNLWLDVQNAKQTLANAESPPWFSLSTLSWIQAYQSDKILSWQFFSQHADAIVFPKHAELCLCQAVIIIIGIFVTNSQILPDRGKKKNIFCCVNKVELMCPNVLRDLVSSLYRLLVLTGEQSGAACCPSSVLKESLSAKVDPAHKKYTAGGSVCCGRQQTTSISSRRTSSGNGTLAARLTCTCAP